MINQQQEGTQDHNISAAMADPSISTDSGSTRHASGNTMDAQFEDALNQAMGDTTVSTAAAAKSSDSGNGETYYVDPNGNDSGDGSAANPWKTIQHAVDSDSPIQAGDTVLVQPGTYNEQITLGKSGSDENRITLKANGDVTINDPDPTGGKFQDGTIQSYSQSNWNIDGFTIKDSPYSGISLHDAHNMTVQNNHTEKTGSSGIIALPGSYFGGGEQEVTSSNIKVLNNTIDTANARYFEGSPDVGQQEALSIWGVDGFEVAGNKVTNGMTEGIDIKVGSRNGSVHDNEVSGVAAISGTSRNSGAAIYLDGNRADQFNIDVYGNYVHDNHANGISVSDEDSSIGSISNIRIHDNIISNNGTLGVNGGQGVDITSSANDVEVYNNKMTGNLQSFDVESAYGATPKNVRIHDNQFLDNKYRPGYAGDNVEGLEVTNNVFSGKGGADFEKGNVNVKESGNTTV
jgi:hypothetical protein